MRSGLSPFGRYLSDPSGVVRNVVQLVHAAVLSAVLSTGAPLQAKARCCKSIRTGFGEIFVAKKDVSLAQELGNHVSRKAKDVLRLGDIRFTIADARHSKYKWADTTSEGLAVYPWKFVHGTNYVALQPPNSILPHEMAHDLLSRHLVANTRTGQYGTDAPDWIDESVAVAFDLPEDKAQRRCEASALLRSAKLIPLPRFLTMQHPDLVSIRGADPAARDFVSDGTMSKETPAFYAMSLAFPEYLSAKTLSASVLADAIHAFQSGLPSSHWVVSRLASAGGGHSIQEVERDFLDWLGSSQDYRCGRGPIKP